MNKKKTKQIKKFRKMAKKKRRKLMLIMRVSRFLWRCSAKIIQMLNRKLQHQKRLPRLLKLLQIKKRVLLKKKKYRLKSKNYQKLLVHLFQQIRITVLKMVKKQKNISVQEMIILRMQNMISLSIPIQRPSPLMCLLIRKPFIIVIVLLFQSRLRTMRWHYMMLRTR